LSGLILVDELQKNASDKMAQARLLNTQPGVGKF
jgi:hypothetical protein